MIGYLLQWSNDQLVVGWWDVIALASIVWVTVMATRK